MKQAGGFRAVARIAVLGVALATGAAPALVPAAGLAQETAQAPVDKVIAALLARGYRIVLQERTFFGRIRIVAETEEIRREMVLNPGTGELLRDYAVLLPGDREGSSGSDNPGVADAGVADAAAANTGVADAGVSVSGVSVSGVSVSGTAPSSGTTSGGPVASASGGTAAVSPATTEGVSSAVTGGMVLPDPIITD